MIQIHLSRKISKEFSVRSFDSMSSLIDETDIVDIVTPTLSILNVRSKQF